MLGRLWCRSQYSDGSPIAVINSVGKTDPAAAAAAEAAAAAAAAAADPAVAAIAPSAREDFLNPLADSDVDDVGEAGLEMMETADREPIGETGGTRANGEDGFCC